MITTCNLVNQKTKFLNKNHRISANIFGMGIPTNTADELNSNGCEISSVKDNNDNARNIIERRKNSIIKNRSSPPIANISPKKTARKYSKAQRDRSDDVQNISGSSAADKNIIPDITNHDGEISKQKEINFGYIPMQFKEELPQFKKLNNEPINPNESCDLKSVEKSPISSKNLDDRIDNKGILREDKEKTKISLERNDLTINSSIDMLRKIVRKNAKFIKDNTPTSVREVNLSAAPVERSKGLLRRIRLNKDPNLETAGYEIPISNESGDLNTFNKSNKNANQRMGSKEIARKGEGKSKISSSYDLKNNRVCENMLRKEVDDAAVDEQLRKMQFFCEICRNKFRTKKNLKAHINRDAFPLQYECSSCSKTFLFKNNCLLLSHTKRCDKTQVAHPLIVKLFSTEEGGEKGRNKSNENVRADIAERKLKVQFSMMNIASNVIELPPSNVFEMEPSRPAPSTSFVQVDGSETNTLTPISQSDIVEKNVTEINASYTSASDIMRNNVLSSRASSSNHASDIVKINIPEIAASTSNPASDIAQNIIPEIEASISDPASDIEQSNIPKAYASTSNPASNIAQNNIPKFGASKPDLVSDMLQKNIAEINATTSDIAQNCLPNTDPSKLGPPFDVAQNNVAEINEPAPTPGMCKECGETVTDRVNHFLNGNHPRSEFKCEICAFCNPSMCSLYAHTRIHNNQSPFVCPECGLIFFNGKTLDFHMKNVCYYPFKKMRYSCPHVNCNAVKSDVVSLVEHIRKHHVDIIYACSNCRYSNADKTLLLEHMAEQHEDAEEIALAGTYACVCCSENAIDTKSLPLHVEQHIIDGKYVAYSYQCDSCTNAFTNPKVFAKHLQLWCAKSGLNKTNSLHNWPNLCANDMQPKLEHYSKPEDTMDTTNAMESNDKNSSTYEAIKELNASPDVEIALSEVSINFRKSDVSSTKESFTDGHLNELSSPEVLIKEDYDTLNDEESSTPGVLKEVYDIPNVEESSASDYLKADCDTQNDEESSTPMVLKEVCDNMNAKELSASDVLDLCDDQVTEMSLASIVTNEVSSISNIEGAFISGFPKEVCDTSDVIESSAPQVLKEVCISHNVIESSTSVVLEEVVNPINIEDSFSSIALRENCDTLNAKESSTPEVSKVSRKAYDTSYLEELAALEVSKGVCDTANVKDLPSSGLLEEASVKSVQIGCSKAVESAIASDCDQSKFYGTAISHVCSKEVDVAVKLLQNFPKNFVNTYAFHPCEAENRQTISYRSPVEENSHYLDPGVSSSEDIVNEGLEMNKKCLRNFPKKHAFEEGLKIRDEFGIVPDFINISIKNAVEDYKKCLGKNNKVLKNSKKCLENRVAFETIKQLSAENTKAMEKTMKCLKENSDPFEKSKKHSEESCVTLIRSKNCPKQNVNAFKKPTKCLEEKCKAMEKNHQNLKNCTKKTSSEKKNQCMFKCCRREIKGTQLICDNCSHLNDATKYIARANDQCKSREIDILKDLNESLDIEKDDFLQNFIIEFDLKTEKENRYEPEYYQSGKTQFTNRYRSKPNEPIIRRSVHSDCYGTIFAKEINKERVLDEIKLKNEGRTHSKFEDVELIDVASDVEELDTVFERCRKSLTSDVNCEEKTSALNESEISKTQLITNNNLKLREPVITSNLNLDSSESNTSKVINKQSEIVKIKLKNPLSNIVTGNNDKKEGMSSESKDIEIIDVLSDEEESDVGVGFSQVVPNNDNILQESKKCAQCQCDTDGAQSVCNNNCANANETATPENLEILRSSANIPSKDDESGSVKGAKVSSLAGKIIAKQSKKLKRKTGKMHIQSVTSKLPISESSDSLEVIDFSNNISDYGSQVRVKSSNNDCENSEIIDFENAKSSSDNSTNYSENVIVKSSDNWNSTKMTSRMCQRILKRNQISPKNEKKKANSKAKEEIFADTNEPRSTKNYKYSTCDETVGCSLQNMRLHHELNHNSTFAAQVNEKTILKNRVRMKVSYVTSDTGKVEIIRDEKSNSSPQQESNGKKRVFFAKSVLQEKIPKKRPEKSFPNDFSFQHAIKKRRVSLEESLLCGGLNAENWYNHFKKPIEKRRFSMTASQDRQNAYKMRPISFEETILRFHEKSELREPNIKKRRLSQESNIIINKIAKKSSETDLVSTTVDFSKPERNAQNVLSANIVNILTPDRIENSLIPENIKNISIPEHIENISIHEHTENISIPERIENISIPEDLDTSSSNLISEKHRMLNLPDKLMKGQNEPKMTKKSHKLITAKKGTGNVATPKKVLSPNELTLPKQEKSSVAETRKVNSSQLEVGHANKHFKSENARNKESAKVFLKSVSPYMCGKCRDANFKSKEEFRMHIFSHRDATSNYQCLECGETFQRNEFLKKHLSNQHGIQRLEAYFKNNRQKFWDDAHRKRIKNIPDSKKNAPGEAPKTIYQCEVCFFKCSSEETLRNHSRAHGMAFVGELSHLPVNIDS